MQPTEDDLRRMEEACRARNEGRNESAFRIGQLEGAIEGAIREIECCIEAIEHPRPTWAAKTAREARQVIEKLNELINYDN